MKTNQSKCGFALVTILCILAALSTTLVMLTTIGSQRVFDVQRMTNKTKAMVYAEAGIDFAYSILSTDFDQRNNPSAFSLDGSETPEEGSVSGLNSSYGEGSFSLSITPVGNNYVVIHSVGECGGITQVAETLIEDIYAGSGTSNAITYADMEGFNYAMFSGGTFDFKGGGNISGAPTIPIHSNSEININGSANVQVSVSSTIGISVGNNTVEGSITAPSLDLHKQATITGGTSIATVPPVSIPDIDFTPYYNWALDHGEVHTGFSVTTDYTPDGGILYVIGDVNISSSVVISGSIIATGDIKISGQVEITPTIDNIAIATGSGNIDNTSSSRITGLVYSYSGDYKQTSNGELYGQLIVGGEIQKGGGSDILFYQQSIPTPPGQNTVNPTESLPVISGWQK